MDTASGSLITQNHSCTIPHSRHRSAWPRQKASVSAVQTEARSCEHWGDRGSALRKAPCFSSSMAGSLTSLCYGHQFSQHLFFAGLKTPQNKALAPPCSQGLTLRGSTTSQVNSWHFLTATFPSSGIAVPVTVWRPTCPPPGSAVLNPSLTKAVNPIQFQPPATGRDPSTNPGCPKPLQHCLGWGTYSFSGQHGPVP